MFPRSEYKCYDCKERHSRQAFISHAGKDAEIAKEAAKACCATKVAPYLFEYSAEFLQPTSSSRWWTSWTCRPSPAATRVKRG